MFNDIAEREHRLLVDAADREQRLLSVAAERDRRTRDEYADREHALMKEAASVRDALLAHDQREIEAERERRLLDDVQRERDLRRDMYDLAAQRSHAAALEAELKCLKANIGPPTVAYEVIDVPVQSADIPPPDVDTAMQMPSSRPVSPIDSIVVQGLSAGIIQRQPPVSIVNRPDTAHTLTSNPNATDTSAECGYRAAGMSTLQPPFLSSEMHEPTAQYIPPQQFNPGFTYQSDTPSRRPEYTFSRSASAVTSMLPCRPAYMPTRTPTVPPPVDDVVISALPRPPAVPVDDHVVTSALPRPPIAPGSVLSIDNTMQRPVDRVDSSNLYANSAERLLAELPPPPHVHTQPILPLSSEYTQTTASEYVNTDSVPSLTAHTYADYSQHLPIAVGEPGLSAFSRVDALQNQPIAVDPTVQYVVSRSASADNVRPTVIPHIAPLQSPSIHWRKQFAYDYIQPDTGLGASTHAAPAVHSGYIRPQTSDTHTHTQTSVHLQNLSFGEGHLVTSFGPPRAPPPPSSHVPQGHMMPLQVPAVPSVVPPSSHLPFQVPISSSSETNVTYLHVPQTHTVFADVHAPFTHEPLDASASACIVSSQPQSTTVTTQSHSVMHTQSVPNPAVNFNALPTGLTATADTVVPPHTSANAAYYCT